MSDTILYLYEPHPQLVHIFTNLLDRELVDLDMSPDDIVNAVNLVAAVELETIMGVAGFRVKYGIMPELFVVVASPFQGAGIGTALVKQLLFYARNIRNYNLVTCSTWDTPVYQGAIKIYTRLDFFERYRDRLHIYYGYPFTTRGYIILAFMPYINRVFPILRDIFNGDLFRAALRRVRHAG